MDLINFLLSYLYYNQECIMCGKKYYCKIEGEDINYKIIYTCDYICFQNYIANNKDKFNIKK